MKTVILKNLYQGENSVKMMIRNGEKIYQQLTKFVFDVDKDSIVFQETGSTDTLTITANEPWTMTVPAWVSASAVSGRSSATITLTSQPTEEYLEGDIVITCNGVQKTVSVTAVVHDYSKDYLTIEAIGDGDFYVRSEVPYYSINGGEWAHPLISTPLSLNQGDKVRFKATPNAKMEGLFSGNTLAFKVYGNIESLEYGDNFTGETQVKLASGFTSYFYNCTGLTEAHNLVLPATTLASYCYGYMFAGVNITKAPELPATTLVSSCYEGMFRYCINLTSAPVLPATTLVSFCYRYMFDYCMNLSYIKCLAKPNMFSDVNLTGWVNNVAETGTFVKAAGANWQLIPNAIPSGWTVIEE